MSTTKNTLSSVVATGAEAPARPGLAAAASTRDHQQGVAPPRGAAALEQQDGRGGRQQHGQGPKDPGCKNGKEGHRRSLQRAAPRTSRARPGQFPGAGRVVSDGQVRGTFNSEAVGGLHLAHNGGNGGFGIQR